MVVCKVAAYIIRRPRSTPSTGLPELLVFAHQDLPDVPIQVPAGTLDPGETLEEALFREIEEESGLTALRLLRKLGMEERLQAGELRQRHYYLLEVTDELPDCWDYQVQGAGFDAGLVFSYYWTNAVQGFEVDESQSAFLSPEAVPELFGQA